MTYPIGCPTGHNFGVMWTNKEAMTIPAGGRVMGPENYFAVVVDQTEGNEYGAGTWKTVREPCQPGWAWYHQY